jgi:DNA-binding NarL/FixJ family response regulator
MKVKKKENKGKEIILKVSRTREISKREREVLKLIAKGFKNREISVKLDISTKTVETHRANIMNKLALRNAAQLIHYAIRTGLVSVDSE